MKQELAPRSVGIAALKDGEYVNEELRGKELYRFILKGKVLSALEIVQLTGYTYGGVMGTIQRLRKARDVKEVEERLVGHTGRPTKFYTWR